MRALQALMMLLGAVAVLMTGAAPANARTDAPSPPCHEAATHPDAGTSSPQPDTALKAMDCCVACVATPNLRSPERARPVPPRPATATPPEALPAGERPAPEPHPPRPTLH